MMPTANKTGRATWWHAAHFLQVGSRVVVLVEEHVGHDALDDDHGSIDDVRIYDRALSAEEVQALYNLGQ